MAPRRVALVWIFASGLLLGAGCGEDALEAGGEGVPARGAPAPEPSGRALAPGAFELAVEDGAVRLRAVRAPRAAVLEELARRARFGLELPALVELPTLTAELGPVPLARALAEIVGPLDYTVEHGWDAQRVAHVVRRVVLSVEAEQAAELTRAEPDRAGPDSMEAALGWERIAALTERLEGQVLSPEIAEQLLSRDPDARAEAVAELDPDGEELPLMLAMLEEDPDGSVRVAVADQLAGMEAYQVVGALIGALDDPEPDVVIAALMSLGLSGDPTVIEAIRPLLEHREPLVRRVAEDMIESLER